MIVFLGPHEHPQNDKPPLLLHLAEIQAPDKVAEPRDATISIILHEHAETSTHFGRLSRVAVGKTEIILVGGPASVSPWGMD